MKLNAIPSMRRNFLASHLRSQIYTLQSVLNVLEKEEEFRDADANEDLRRVENSLRQLRKLNSN